MQFWAKPLYDVYFRVLQGQSMTRRYQLDGEMIQQLMDLPGTKTWGDMDSRAVVSRKPPSLVLHLGRCCCSCSPFALRRKGLVRIISSPCT